MKKLIVILMLSLFAYSGILDAYYVKKGESAYKSGNYKEALENFLKVEKPNDKLRYDIANSYYKLKKYSDSIREYQKISDKDLEFQKLHNLGNAYAKSKQIDAAIKAYEDALKIKEDKDTRYNLELLKKLKKQQKQKRNQKNNKKDKSKKDKKNQKNKKNQNGNNSSQNQNSKKESKKEDKKQKDKEKNSNKKQNNKDRGKDKKDKQKQKDKTSRHVKRKNMAVKKAPISDMEEKKYLKMLEGRKINSLLLPMNNKGEKSETVKPW